MFRAFRTTVREHPKALFVVAATWAVLPALALIPAAIMLLTLDGDIRFSFSDEPDEDIVRWAYAIELVWANVIALVGFFVTCALIAFFRDGRRSPLARIVANSRRFVASITVVALYFAIATAWYFYSATTGSEAPWVGFFLNVAGVFVTVGALIAIAAGRPGASRRRWAALVAAIVALQAAGIAVWTLARGVDPQLACR